MNTILIIGAFDRFNYGDLLFPIIIEQQLKTYGVPVDIRYFGMVSSDLQALGGKPTEGIQAFYEWCNQGTQRVNVIVAGGEAIAVTWNSLLVALDNRYRLVRRYQHHLERIVDLNKWAKRKLKGKTDLPFVFERADFQQVDYVLFNSLGGSEIPEKIFKQVHGLVDKLKRVDYFSVRDSITQHHLEKKGIRTYLYPDSAILMSKFYSLDRLQALAKEEVRAFVSDKKGNYLFFQINRNHAKQHEVEIGEQLNKIYQETGTWICLCPIGTASNHNDDEALKLIHPRIQEGVTLFEGVGVWDIMCLIAHAKCYMGTSLHGAITAMSYAIPYVGVNVKKLNSYLGTWGVGPLQQVVSLHELWDQYQRAVLVEKNDLEESRFIQIKKIEESFGRMSRLLFAH